jgi:phospholipid/cholesterol/gamma-HCH transport system substrate-binding protein
VTLARIDELLAAQRQASTDPRQPEMTSAASRRSGRTRPTRAEIDKLLRTVNRLLDRNRGEIGHAITDLHDSLEAVAQRIDAISQNLEVSTRNLSEFSRQIRENPGVLVRGREAAPEPAGAP